MGKSPATRRPGARRIAPSALLAVLATAALLTLPACGRTPAVSGSHAASAQAAAPATAPVTAPVTAPATAPAAPATLPPGRSPLQGVVPVGAGPALCAAIGQLRTVTITREVTLPNRLHFPFPARVKVTDPPGVRAVATAACQLPQLPRVMVACPADLGISYRLAFTAPGRTYPALTAAATGCAKLVGLDVTRQVVPSFWVTLGRAMNLPSPGAASFGGSPR